MTWQVVGDTAVLVGGIRALLVQAAHPEVVAGVAEHSRYRQDPLGRLSRTSAYVTATSFGAMPEVERAVAIVRKAHRPVVGLSHRGLPYDAADPALAAWVHNSMTDSFLTAFRTSAPGRARRPTPTVSSPNRLVSGPCCKRTRCPGRRGSSRLGSPITRRSGPHPILGRQSPSCAGRLCRLRPASGTGSCSTPPSQLFPDASARLSACGRCPAMRPRAGRPCRP